jgi:hypothetical protein
MVPGKRLIVGPFVLGSHLGFANATSLARMRHPRFFFAELRWANARCARYSARLRLAGYSFPQFPKMYVYFLVTFFVVSILIAGMASKQGTFNFRQKKKAPEPDNTFVNNVSVPRRGRATPLSQASLYLFAILYWLLFLLLPHSLLYAPPKKITKKCFLFPNISFCSHLFFALNFF